MSAPTDAALIRAVLEAAYAWVTSGGDGALIGAVRAWDAAGCPMPADLGGMTPEMRTREERVAWDMYAAAVIGRVHEPRTGIAQAAAAIADETLAERRERWGQP